jgi:hypothetical protein
VTAQPGTTIVTGNSGRIRFTTRSSRGTT